MRRIALFIAIICATVVSCTKTVKIPVSYRVETENSVTGIVEDAYLPITGAYHLRLVTKFLTGNNTDSVTLRISGLPGGITSSIDSFKGQPTYTADFVLTTLGAPYGATYPVTIVATAPGTTPVTYTFHIHIVPADCASFLAGSYSGTNACTARSYPYTLTAAATGVANQLAISNLGGYGAATTCYATVNCQHDSLTIPTQNIGNGTIVTGYGVFTNTGMSIWYSASSVPAGGSESCSADYTKQ